MAADDHQKSGKTTATGAVSPNNSTKKPKERIPVKPELTDINQYIMCSLCSGYLIDATAIIECQHTFCKSCILKYLETHGYCPICDVELNTVKPHLSLRSDVIVQRLVYKLVPGLLVSELRRRREDAESNGSRQTAESISNDVAEEVNSSADSSTILSLDDVVSLSIEYFTSDDDGVKKKPKKSQHSPNHAEIKDIKTIGEANDRRYLKCPAAVSVGLLKKFIRMKYDLSDDYRVDLLYNGDRDNSLENDLTLLDIAFIFKWNKEEPMQFHYQIFERTVKNLVSHAGSKRPISSMMDEPPDDDASSGPPNRPSMSSSSAPKFPRMSNNSSTRPSNYGGSSGGSARTTCNLTSSRPVYEFSEGNSDAEETTLQRGKLTFRGFRSKDSSTNSSGQKRSPSRGIDRRSSGTNTSPAKSSSSSGLGSQESDASEDEDSDSSSSESEEARVAKITNSRVRSAAETVLQSQINGGLKINTSTTGSGERREPLKLSLSSVVAKSPEHKHKHKHHKMKHKKKHKSLKISLSLNPSANSDTATSQNQGKSILGKPVKVSGEGGSQKGLGKNKATEGSGNGTSGNQSRQGNFPVGVKSTTSAHLTNISKSISVSIGVGNSNQTSSSGTKEKQSQFTNKLLTPTGLIPKNTGIEIQPTTISNQGTSNTPLNSHQSGNNARSHPLLPESVHVPKSVTLIPVNPNNTTGGGSGSSSSVGRVSSGGGSTMGNVMEKAGFNSMSNNSSSRLNTHTFIHPRTNKSLHQITVTEVPPPSGKSGNTGNSNSGLSSSCGSAGNVNVGAPSGHSSNPIEKVIANAANKPQFNGPGSMEITKIYCNTKDGGPAKKLKERKGLDISITAPPVGNDNKKPQGQKVGIHSAGMSISNNNNNNNKTKGANQTAGPVFNAKMPPGITIGPVGTNKSNTVGNTIPGLGFTLPPHITAHPQQQTSNKHLLGKIKQGDKPKSLIGPKSQVVGMNKTPVSQPSKTMTNKAMENRKQLDSALASMIDMANRNAMKSPSPPKTKDGKMPTITPKPEKRGFDMSSSSRKSSRDSPDPKRPKSNEMQFGCKAVAETPLDLSSAGGRTSRPNSTDSPSFSGKNSPNTSERRKSDSPLLHAAKRSPTPPVPKTSPTTVSPGFPSPSGKSGQNKGSSPSISSIAQTLAQKQLSQQQQKEHQILHSQLMQLQQGLRSIGSQSSGMKCNSLSPKSAAGTPPASSFNSLSPPIIPMPNPSPPTTGFDPLKNLLTLSDAAAVRHGKVHPMNSLMAAAAGLCSPQTHPGLSLPSPSSVTSASLFPHFVTSLGGGKTPPGMLDASTHAYLAAISAHNERLAAAAGMSHFGDVLSPPMSMQNSFFPQVRPPSCPSNPHGSLRIPSVPPKSNSVSTCKKGSSPTPPHSFSHPPINTSVSTCPKSPTKTTPISSSSSSSPTTSTSSSSSSAIKSQDSSLTKNTRINGTSFSSHLPILPPGIRNPLLPSYPRSSTSSSTLQTQNAAKSMSDKKGIPNSMKISNFLPNKPKSLESANVEATITSGSNVGGSSLSKFLNSISPVIDSQSQSNLSVSSPKEFSRVFGTSGSNNKSSNEQECGQELKTGSSSNNPIKQESAKPITSDPITCQRNAVTPVTESSSDKVNEIKAEVTSLLRSSSCSPSKVTPAVLGLISPPSSRTTQAQPLNQAVRHIPNPALLFNRQTTSHKPNGTATSPISSSSVPFGSKTPLSLEELALQVPALPYPGVSVPVQVKVENDPLPIPIAVDNTTASEPICAPSRDDNNDSNPQESKSLILNESQSGENETSENSSNEPIESVEIKIECPTEDTNQNVDVGIEEIEPISYSEGDKQDQPENVPNPDKEMQIPADTWSEVVKECENDKRTDLEPAQTEDKEVNGEENLLAEENERESKVMSEPECAEGSSNSEGMEIGLTLASLPLACEERQGETLEESELSTQSKEGEAANESAPMELEFEKSTDNTVSVEETLENPEQASENATNVSDQPATESDDKMDYEEAGSAPVPADDQESMDVDVPVSSSELVEDDQESRSQNELEIDNSCAVILPAGELEQVNDDEQGSLMVDNETQESDEKVMNEINDATELDASASCSESQTEDNSPPLEIPTSPCSSNQISNPVDIYSNPVQAFDTAIPAVLPASCEDTEDKDSVLPSNNAEQSEDEPTKLMDSSSTPQLELNCPSEHTNDMELNTFSLFDDGQTSALIFQSSSSPSVGEEMVDDKKCDNDDGESHEKYEENAEAISTFQATKESLDECLLSAAEGIGTFVSTSPITFPFEIPPSDETVDVGSSTKVDIVFVSEEQPETSEYPVAALTPSSPFSAQINCDSDSSSNPVVISATITTTTASQVETNVGSLESSSRNSVESPLSPGDCVTSTEALDDEDSAEVFASSGNNINNNNNKSLTINASTCDIVIGPSSGASDLATV